MISNFAAFLTKNNATAAYNDATTDYLAHLIQLEKNQVASR